MSGDLSKAELYEGVKTLVECPHDHIHLNQQKLFTLFSLGFQYLLFQSTKKPGAYIIRVEDAVLADKLAKKAKDPSTRKFMQSLLIPRKMKFDKSMFFLDYFHVTSWNLTNDIPRDKIQGALIVKNTQAKLMDEIDPEDKEAEIISTLSKDYFLTGLMENSPKTITIAFEEVFDQLTAVNFPFIKKEKEKTLAGVTITEEFDWE
ncbi:MAG: hypothetical protein L6Q33_15740 [Bacteriovoracaceae bacterium]|jgi:hypothetical protein|nr:hypothetical protein [Bacteriovoracaceae bacterium]